MKPAIAYFVNSDQPELKKQGERHEIGVVGLEEALVIFQRHLSNASQNPETTDEFAHAWSIGFFRSSEEFIDCSADRSRNVDVHWGTSVDNIPWLLRPFCGSLEVERLHPWPVDAEERVHQFFTLSSDRLREAIREDIRKKEGPRWMMWIGRIAIIICVIYIAGQAILDNNLRPFYAILLFAVFYLLSAILATLMSKRCSNCKTTLYDRRLRLDGRCHRCNMLSSPSENEFSSAKSECRDH